MGCITAFHRNGEEPSIHPRLRSSALIRVTQEMVFARRSAHSRCSKRGIYDHMKTTVEDRFVGRDRLYNRRLLRWNWTRLKAAA
jgi:hypothetical protein